MFSNFEHQQKKFSVRNFLKILMWKGKRVNILLENRVLFLNLSKYKYRSFQWSGRQTIMQKLFFLLWTIFKKILNFNLKLKILYWKWKIAEMNLELSFELLDSILCPIINEFRSNNSRKKHLCTLTSKGKKGNEVEFSGPVPRIFTYINNIQYSDCFAPTRFVIYLFCYWCSWLEVKNGTKQLWT